MAAPVYGSLDNATVQKHLAARTLMQLYRNALLPRAGSSEFSADPGFEYMQTISVRRPKITVAEEYNPRSGSDASLVEPGYVIVNVTLEKLFTQGFPIYSHDAQMNVDKYLADYTETNEGALRLATDQYYYDRCFRDYQDIPDTGNVRVGATSPLQIVSTTYNGTQDSFAEYDGTAQIRAKTALVKENVPVTNLYMLLSPQAHGGFLGDQVMVTGDAAATAPMFPGGQIIESPGVDFIKRFDFWTAPSNAVGSQAGLGAVGTFDTNSWDTTIYLKDDYYDNTPLNVLVLSIGTGTHSNAAKGRIVTFEINSRRVFGVILRVVDTATIHVKPYYEDGTEVPVNTTVASATVTVPSIPSINVGFHSQHLVYASRLLVNPSPGSGAIGVAMSFPTIPLVLQIIAGGYEVNRLRESNRLTFLTGAVPTDYRKAVLVLSA